MGDTKEPSNNHQVKFIFNYDSSTEEQGTGNTVSSEVASTVLQTGGDDELVTFSVPEPETSTQPIGSLNLLSQKYESLDYDTCENQIYLEDQKNTRSLFGKREVLRWMIIFLIGMLTAMTASCIVMAVDILSEFKYHCMKDLVDRCVTEDCLYFPFLFWLATNAIPVALGSALVTYVAPVAAGSGIPVIKCYLNGVKIPEVVRVKTYIAKFFGVITSVVGGLAVGKEGPMIHCGAIIAAGISQGKSTTLNKDFKVLTGFRDDREKRDFVSGGAAAGVAAAFGAPVGGVLFSLEEGASFWNQALTWRIFFCSMISTFSLNLILSAYHQHFGQLSYSGLINFGKFADINYSFVELPIYILMGAIGGLLGALYNFVNHKLCVFRMRYLYRNWMKVIEASVMAMITASIGFLLIFYSKDCRKYSSPTNETGIKFPIQFHCPAGEYSVMAALWFNTPEATVRNLFHSAEAWTASTLSVFSLVYFVLTFCTYGLSISSGLFIPTLLVGAAWGRLISVAINLAFPSALWVYPGKFALIGAAAMLGGVVRMTISLTVILIEATGNLTFGLPIMITLMVAKWVGDYFIEGLYDIHIQLASVPILGWEPPSLANTVYASEVMSTPVTTFNMVETVVNIIEVLTKQTHNGFPVVDSIENENDEEHFLYSSSGTQRKFGRFRGLILRWQLIVALQEKIFNETSENTFDKLNMNTFRAAYPRYPDIREVIKDIKSEEKNYHLDLRPLMNPSAYSVTNAATCSRIFRLFRALGLRHLVVVDDRNKVIGIVTRKDLARYRMEKEDGRDRLHELQISHN